MITPEQARAARAMLAWKQSDLAREAGVSVTAVNYFEREIGTARSDTIEHMQNALERTGIEFLSGGVRQKRDAFQLINHQGNDFVSRLNEDMQRALYKGSTEIITCSSDESAWNRYDTKTNQEYLAFAETKQIRERILVTEGSHYINSKNVVYRMLPENLIGKITYTVYTDRVAYLLWTQKRVVILRNPDLAASLQSQFNFLWDQARPFRPIRAKQAS